MTGRAVLRAVTSTVTGLVVCAALLAQSPSSPALIDVDALLADARRLAADDMQGRQVGTPGNAAARALLVARFRAVGLEPIGDTFEHPFPMPGGVRGVNVLGRLPGRLPDAPHIVVSAHYDHIGVHGGQVYNGANDNASGAAALPVIAEYFRRHPTRHPLLFAAFDAEEADLAGSRAFVAEPPVRRDRIAFNLNLDMIGRDPDNILWVAGTSRSPWLAPIVADVARRAPVVLRQGYDDPARPADDWTRQSDQWSFIEAGVPAAYVGVSDFDLHHHPDDDFDSLTADFYVRAVETIIALVEAIDAALETAGP